MNLEMNDNEIKEKKSVKYLGIIMDYNLNWKDHVFELSKKVSRGIGILFKLRDFVSTEILIQVYYSLIYPFLIYAVLVWGHTYKSNLHPLVILQKKAMRIMTFSGFREHSSPLFKRQKLLKFLDIVYVNTASFMLQYGLGNLPADYDDFFTAIKHDYAMRLASTNTYIIPSVRTNYGIFNIRYSGPKMWSSVDESLKSLNLNIFKRKLKDQIIASY